MRRQLAILCTTLAMFTSCNYHGEDNSWTLSHAEDAICDPLEKQKLFSIAMGPRGYQDTADKFWLGFKSSNYHFTNPDQARPFFVGVIQHILDGYNNSPKIRPFLKSYPVKISDLWIKINFYKHLPNAPLPPSELYRIELKNSVISYYKWDTAADDLALVASEPYAEAYQKSGKSGAKSTEK